MLAKLFLNVPLTKRENNNFSSLKLFTLYVHIEKKPKGPRILFLKTDVELYV